MTSSWEDRLTAAGDTAQDDPDTAEAELRAVRDEMQARIKEIRERIAQPRHQARRDEDDRIRQYFLERDTWPRIKDSAAELGLPVHRILKIRQAVQHERYRAMEQERNLQRYAEERQEVINGRNFTAIMHTHDLTFADIKRGDFLEYGHFDSTNPHAGIQPVDHPTHLIALNDAEKGQTVNYINVG